MEKISFLLSWVIFAGGALMVGLGINELTGNVMAAYDFGLGTLFILVGLQTAISVSSRSGG